MLFLLLPCDVDSRSIDYELVGASIWSSYGLLDGILGCTWTKGLHGTNHRNISSQVRRRID